MRKVIGLLIVVTAALPAYAQAPRSVPYFITHSDERVDVKQTCFGGISSPLHDAECINAHQADHWLQAAEAKRTAQQNSQGIGSMDSPRYYDANPISRMIVLRDCVNPISALHPTTEMCQAARISAGGSSSR